jgi:hypothetical protein
VISIVTLELKEAMDLVLILYKAKFFNNPFTVNDYKEIEKYHDLLAKKIRESQLNKNE